MSDWLGLHNPERHETGDGYEGAYCATCLNNNDSAWCYSNSACRCCLEAEVERLTAELADRTVCDACNGTGQWVDYPAVSCPKCHGCTRCTAPPSDLPDDDGQRLDVNELLSSRMEQVHRAEQAEAEVEQLTAAIQRVRQLLEKYVTAPCSEMSQTDALGAIGKALDGADSNPPQGHLQFYGTATEGYTAVYRPVLLREVCPATNTLLGEPVRCDRGVGHGGPHMTRESWQWFDAPEEGDA